MTGRPSLGPCVEVGLDIGHYGPAPGLYHGEDRGSHGANPDSNGHSYVMHKISNNVDLGAY